MSKKINIKQGDLVKVISGENRGSEGKVLAVDRKKNRVTVEKVNVVSKHTKPNSENPEGGIVEQEAGIHISNVMLISAKGPSRVGRKADDKGKLVRYFKKTGEVVK